MASASRAPSAAHAHAAEQLRREWAEVVNSSTLLGREDMYDSVMARDVKAAPTAALKNRALPPERSKRQLRLQRLHPAGAAALAPQPTHLALPAEFEQIPSIRQRLFQTMVAISWWQPEFGAALPFEQLIVALVLGAQSERVALHCFALLYKAYRLADYAQEGEVGASSQEAPGRSSTGAAGRRGHGDPAPARARKPAPPAPLRPGLVELPQVRATPSADPTLPVAIFAASRAAWERLLSSCGACAGEAPPQDGLQEDALWVLGAVRQSWPGVAGTFERAGREQSLLAMLVSWLGNFLATGCSESADQIEVFLPLVSHMLRATGARPRQHPRHELRRVALLVLGRHHKRIEACAGDSAALDELTAAFRARPPLDDVVLAMLAADTDADGSLSAICTIVAAPVPIALGCTSLPVLVAAASPWLGVGCFPLQVAGSCLGVVAAASFGSVASEALSVRWRCAVVWALERNLRPPSSPSPQPPRIECGGVPKETSVNERPRSVSKGLLLDDPPISVFDQLAPDDASQPDASPYIGQGQGAVGHWRVCSGLSLDDTWRSMSQLWNLIFVPVVEPDI